MNKYILEAVYVSFLYLMAYVATLGLILPLQKMFFPTSFDIVGLLFLPHGVRALAFIFFGFRAVLYLLPISYFGWALAARGYGISLDPLSPIYTLLACMFGYVLFLLLNKILRIKVNKYIWYFPVYLGVLLAVFNSISLTSLADSEEFITFAASYFVGDVMGMFVFLFLVMFAFRYIRKFKQLPIEY